MCFWGGMVDAVGIEPTTLRLTVVHVALALPLSFAISSYSLCSLRLLSFLRIATNTSPIMPHLEVGWAQKWARPKDHTERSILSSAITIKWAKSQSSNRVADLADSRMLCPAVLPPTESWGDCGQNRLHDMHVVGNTQLIWNG